MKWRLLASMGWAGRAFWAGMFVLLVALAARLLWRASHTETGFGSLAIQWRDATAGWIVGPYEPVYTREPPEQAAYWLAEVDRVLAAHPDDPALAMGAAIVLDSPCEGCLPQYVIQRTTPLGDFSEWDSAAIVEGGAAFETLCGERCLELSARATKLDPTNVDWWRLRALLQRPEPFVYFDTETTPRDPDWLRTLDECARHDPDNALYDYMAACFYWKAATKETSFRNTTAFKKGIARFEQGNSKHVLAAVDASGLKAAADFLVQTRVPLSDDGPLVGGRCIGVRRATLFGTVFGWQQSRADLEESAGHVDAALALRRQTLRLIGQYEKGGPTQAYDQIAVACKLEALSQMRVLADAAPGAVSQSDKQQILALIESTLVEQEVLRCALRDVSTSQAQAWAQAQAQAQGQPWAQAQAQARGPVNVDAYGRWASADVLLADAAPSLVVLLVALGLVAIILARRFADPSLPVVGPVKQVGALIVATATTAVFLGLAPAEVIIRPLQWWFFTIVLFALPVLVALWIGWRWLQLRSFQFSLSALLLLTLIASVLFSMVAVLRPQEYHEFYFSHLPFPLSVPRHSWHGISAAASSGIEARPHDPWLGAACQWVGYHGPSVTVALWVGLVALLYRPKGRKIAWLEDTPFPSRWMRLAGLCRSLGQPALALAAMLLAADLFLAPGLVERAEQRFQDAIAVGRQSPTDGDAIDAAAQKVRSDAARMSRLRQSAKTGAAKLTPEAVRFGAYNAAQRAMSNGAPTKMIDPRE